MNKVPEKKGITINEAKKLINAANPTDLLNLGLEIQLQLAMAEKSKNLIPEKDLKFVKEVATMINEKRKENGVRG